MSDIHRHTANSSLGEFIPNVDIGNLCTHCGEDTALGTGLFVNRIPSGTDGTLVMTAGDADGRVSVTIDGYMCPACQ